MPDNICPNCGGDGLDGGENCVPCLGTGIVSTAGVNLRILTIYNLVAVIPSDLVSRLDDLQDKVDDIKEKVDEIKEVVDEL